jgi:hypothetical protein
MATPAPPTPPSNPDALLHLAQARQNYQLYQELKRGGQHLDWAVTLLFYTALHLTEAYLVERASSAFDLPRGHEERSAAIRRALPQIHADYQFLRTRSTWARYHIHKPKPTPELLRQYETQPFARIVAELRRLGFRLAP